MPAALALPAFWGAVTAGAAGTAAVVAGHEQASAATDAANTTSAAATKAAQLQTDAANHSADVQGKSAANALAFQEKQAAQDLATANATQRANYDQWAAKEGRLSTLGQSIGLKPFQIPSYVPITSASGVTQTGTPAGTVAPSGVGAAAPSAASGAPNVTTLGSAIARAPALNVPQPLAGAAPAAQGGFVNMKNVAGQVQRVPMFQVEPYKAIGYSVVQ